MGFAPLDNSHLNLTQKVNPVQGQIPEISFGSMPNDGGNLLLDDLEKEELLKQTLLIKKMHLQELNQIKIEKEELQKLSRIAEDALNEARSREESLGAELL